MPGIEEKNETEDEDMEQDTPESDKSDDDDSESGSGSDEDASSGRCQQCKLLFSYYRPPYVFSCFVQAYGVTYINHI